MPEYAYRDCRARTLPFQAWGGMFRPETLPLSLLEALLTPLSVARQPFKGISSDGSIRTGLFHLAEPDGSLDRLRHAARHYLDILDPQHAGVLFAMEAHQRRLWHNAFMPWVPHGLLLQTATVEERTAALAVIELSSSERGYRDIRTTMEMNALLGRLVKDGDRNLTEWMYWFTVFGDPSSGDAWGWQIAGHHLCLNCTVVEDAIVLSPTFMGAEPGVSDDVEGRYAGLALFQEEQAAGLSFVRSLSGAQQAQAVLFGSMRSEDLPPEYNHPADGRHRGGAGQDNATVPYQGIAARELSDAHRRQLLDLMSLYADRMPPAQAAAQRALIDRHLDETYFCWIGRVDDDHAPFYYRIHSPVIMIEFDHHAGLFLDNPEAEQFHVHTLVRTPNGNDYGMELLRQQRARREVTTREGAAR